MSNPTNLKELLDDDEGKRYRVYDDANENLIVPGYTLKGHPTIGCGRALDVNGISESELQMMLDNDIAKWKAVATDHFSPWYSGLCLARQDVIVSMLIGMGLGGISEFHGMLAALATGDFEKAANEMLDSHWARDEAPDRAHRLSKMMLYGKYPE